MKNYKAMKSAKSWSVKKAKVVDRAAVSEIKDDDGKVMKDKDGKAYKEKVSVPNSDALRLFMTNPFLEFVDFVTALIISMASFSDKPFFIYI